MDCKPQEGSADSMFAVHNDTESVQTQCCRSNWSAEWCEGSMDGLRSGGTLVLGGLRSGGYSFSEASVQAAWMGCGAVERSAHIAQ